MDYRDIFAAVSREPFKPFRLQLSGGQTYEIETADSILVGPKVIEVRERPLTGIRLLTSAVVAIETPEDFEDLSDAEDFMKVGADELPGPKK